MLVLLGIAFAAGLITTMSPCVLPVLPILLAGGAATSDRTYPFKMIAGLVTGFTGFTLAGASLLNFLGLPADFLRDLAIVLLLFLAATLVSRRFASVVERPFLFLTRRGVSSDRGAFVLGVSLALVFVPCAGPVLAAVTALSASGEVGVRTFVVTASYSLGVALPMLLIASSGQRLASGFTLLREHAEAVRRGAGVLLGVTAVVIALGADRPFTTAIPGYTNALQDRFERSSIARRELNKLGGLGAVAATPPAGGALVAPEFQGLSHWLNSPGGDPPSIASLRGKVVLVDFWTYSCINCLRTLPHVKSWFETYEDAGFVVVGVHSPEFAFERVPDNVRSAVQRLGIRYPVGLDNDFRTWSAYDNEYWPAKYLIDRSGRIRYTHFGEGQYGETETWIQRLLGEKGKSHRSQAQADLTPTKATTPESYLGYARLERFAGARITLDTAGAYRFPSRRLRQDEIAYAGRWTVGAARIVAGQDARLRIQFQSRSVFLVLGGSGAITVVVDGRRQPDVSVSGVPRLYTIASLPSYRSGVLELRFTPGLEAYVFTFG